jgi:tetratricopeptide (TPR) repeat protein
LSPDRKRTLLVLAAVAGFAAALHARAATFGYSYLDDDTLLLGEQQRFFADPSSVWRAFTRPYFAGAERDHAFYRPLPTASFALDARWSGSAPRGAHVTNIALHAAAACLVFRLLRRLRHTNTLALGGALAFAAHPALVSAVAWIPGRADLLLGVAALAAWLCFARAFEPRRWGSRVGHAIALLAALLSKEAALVLPPVLVAYAVVVERRPWRALLAPWLLAGWGAALTVYFAARAAVLAQGMGAGGVSFGRAAANAPLFLTSLGKLVLPIRLSVMATPEDSLVWPGVVAALALLAAFAARGVRRPSLAFALAGFVAFVAPSLPASTLLALECRLYLPAVAVILAACEIARAVPGPAAARATAGGAVIASLAIASFVHAGNFRDRRTFAEAAVRGSPHASLAHKNLGVTLHLAGDIEGARRAYEAALAEDAGEPIAHNNLAVILLREGRLPEAEAHLRAELAINPRYPPAHENLALVLRALGRTDEAAAELRLSERLAAESR